MKTNKEEEIRNHTPEKHIKKIKKINLQEGWFTYDRMIQ